MNLQDYNTIRNHFVNKRTAELPYYTSLRNHFLHKKLWSTTKPSNSSKPLPFVAIAPTASSSRSEVHNVTSAVSQSTFSPQLSLLQQISLPEPITLIKFPHNSNTEFICASSTGSLYHVHLYSSTFSFSQLPSFHRASVSSINFSKTNSLLVTTSHDKTVAVWDFQSKTPIKIYYSKVPITSLSIFDSNDNYCSYSTPKSITILNLSNGNSNSINFNYAITTRLSVINDSVIFGTEQGNLVFIPVNSKWNFGRNISTLPLTPNFSISNVSISNISAQNLVITTCSINGNVMQLICKSNLTDLRQLIGLNSLSLCELFPSKSVLSPLISSTTHHTVTSQNQVNHLAFGVDDVIFFRLFNNTLIEQCRLSTHQSEPINDNMIAITWSSDVVYFLISYDSGMICVHSWNFD
ncbi:hypothetical protein RCL1_008359 [Eukaryota sp. TZLM3-RCL]